MRVTKLVLACLMVFGLIAGVALAQEGHPIKGSWLGDYGPNKTTRTPVFLVMQIISPRPYQMMHSESPKLVAWYTEEANSIIARQTKLFPNVFRGVCGLPQSPGISIKECLPYLEKCVKEDGFVGCLINPDPGEGSSHQTPPLGDRYWYPLYEKLCELDIVGHIHSAGCRSERLTYSLHFINEESIAVVSLLTSSVFKDFPKLKIVMSHGGSDAP